MLLSNTKGQKTPKGRKAEQMRLSRAFAGLVSLACVAASAALGNPASRPDTGHALARIEAPESRIADVGGDLQIDLALSSPVPWRVFTLDDPRRLVLDFGRVDFRGTRLETQVVSDHVAGVTAGQMQDGWSRMVIDLREPLRIETAGLTTSPADYARLKLQLTPTDADSFAAEAGPPEVSLVEPASRTVAPLRRQRGERALRVVLDPGHGGIDPGAEAGDLKEADLVLDVARDLARALEAVGMEVTLTRTEDVFVPLPTRMSIARKARADVLLSLHADALEEGSASGATVYTLSTEAAARANGTLAARHARHDLLAGVDLSGAGDEVALVLMDMARTETQPRADQLADEIVSGLARETGDLHKRPRLRANFSVLRAPDIPSVLIELGFLSSAVDREKLQDPQWRQAAVEGIRGGLENWARIDAQAAGRVRQ